MEHGADFCHHEPHLRDSPRVSEATSLSRRVRIRIQDFLKESPDEIWPEDPPEVLEGPLQNKVGFTCFYAKMCCSGAQNGP